MTTGNELYREYIVCVGRSTGLAGSKYGFMKLLTFRTLFRREFWTRRTRKFLQKGQPAEVGVLKAKGSTADGTHNFNFSSIPARDIKGEQVPSILALNHLRAMDTRTN